MREGTSRTDAAERQRAQRRVAIRRAAPWWIVLSSIPFSSLKEARRFRESSESIGSPESTLLESTSSTSSSLSEGEELIFGVLQSRFREGRRGTAEGEGGWCLSSGSMTVRACSA